MPRYCCPIPSRHSVWIENPVELIDNEWLPATWAHEIERAAERAVDAGAVPPLTYHGMGMTGVVFSGQDGRAYKVYRSDTPMLRRMAFDEAEWLIDAGAVPAIAHLIPEVYELDEENLVLVREYVEGTPGGWGTGSVSFDLHRAIEASMIPYGWSAPEYKEDSYVFDDDGNFTLVDASMPHRLCDRALRYVEDILEGRRPWYDSTPGDLAFDIRREMFEGCVDEDRAERALETLYAMGAERP